MVVKKATLEEAIETAKDILLDGAEAKQDWLNRYETDMKMVVVPMDVLSTMYLKLSEKEKKTIRIEIFGGVLTEVTGLPEGMNYLVIDHDNIDAGDSPHCPECNGEMELAEEDVEGQGRNWLCQNCKVHFPEEINEPVKKEIPPARCGICGGIIIGDNFSESQGILTHQQCPEPDYGAMEAEGEAEAEAEYMAQCQAEEEAQAEREAEIDHQHEHGG